MSQRLFRELNEILLKQRREVFKLVSHLEADLKTLKDRDIESADGAQTKNLALSLNQLNERGKKELTEIDLALERLKAGTYGNCELCQKQIAIKRLTVLPVTRLCRKCAYQYEKAQEIRHRPRDEIIDIEHLEEYRSLDEEKVPLKNSGSPIMKEQQA